MANAQPPVDINIPELAVIAARQHAHNQGPLAEEMGTTIFGVGEGWAASVMKKEAEFTKVDSLAALKTALEDTSAVSVFVLKSAGLALSQIVAALRTSGQRRTIYLEDPSL